MMNPTLRIWFNVLTRTIDLGYRIDDDHDTYLERSDGLYYWA